VGFPPDLSFLSLFTISFLICHFLLSRLGHGVQLYVSSILAFLFLFHLFCFRLRRISHSLGFEPAFYLLVLFLGIPAFVIFTTMFMMNWARSKRQFFAFPFFNGPGNIFIALGATYDFLFFFFLGETWELLL